MSEVWEVSGTWQLQIEDTTGYLRHPEPFCGDWVSGNVVLQRVEVAGRDDRR